MSVLSGFSTSEDEASPGSQEGGGKLPDPWRAASSMVAEGQGKDATTRLPDRFWLIEQNKKICLEIRS